LAHQVLIFMGKY